MITSGTAMMMVSARTATVGAGAEESVSDTEKLKEPGTVGVPEIMPVAGSSDRPGGRLPLRRAQTSGAVPPKDVSVAD